MVRDKTRRVSLGTQWFVQLVAVALVSGCSGGPAEESSPDTACRAGTTECDGRCVDVATPSRVALLVDVGKEQTGVELFALSLTTGGLP